jgi:hypothetical protein
MSTRFWNACPGTRAVPAEFDLVLLDYALPGLDALEALKVLRGERGLDIPLVIVSGQGSEDDRGAGPCTWGPAITSSSTRAISTSCRRPWKRPGVRWSWPGSAPICARPRSGSPW